MQIDSLLVNESQLGSQLNHCVVEKRRSDFSLMLAMLSEDVRDFSEFHRAENNPHEQIIDPEVQLRRLFDLPKSQPLALESLEDIAHFNQAGEVVEQHFDDIRLKQCLAPKPLAFRDDKAFIPSQIKANLSLCQQQRLSQPQSKSIAQAPNTNVANWLKNVKTSLVKADSIALHSIA
ncbi:queD like 2 [Thalassotalea sp. LPB0316]|uniref:VC2046/SO_2500 family protein n=1 Tax=Thalassotalea sp. LPB0316 TaxID=2769490 RepID=UPI0018665EFD|nr:VC2046/SO_2500 family protein [Thalassotalea sp. LPB0316]QOL25163.1 queD like 2 [Thalassotalea sp. LPB0316]